jgi:hypothetical protein
LHIDREIRATRLALSNLCREREREKGKTRTAESRNGRERERERERGRVKLRGRRGESMDAAKVAQLKLFVQQCEANPAILQDPSLAFFRSYLEKSVSL